ncbi:TRAP transporter small permease subunit [Balneatrix alpica]|uniref:TRAP transporter small permease protein n=1 Tax=Balneatrix alpica TaxID=75684 RepID=A0ABV5ZGZ2_9GAMM|nr:TRAP transporter small permease subunit [Balneatrix alpica]
MRNAHKYLDHVSIFLGQVAMLLVCLLVGSMLFEVAARYVFQAPTLWAFDLSYMFNGSLFLLAGAYSLKHEAHVRIDFLSRQLPIVIQQNLNGLVYAFLAGPAFAVFAWIATEKTYKAYLTGEVESTSPWAPLIWPFYAALAIGLIAFTLQLYLEASKFMLRVAAPGHCAEAGDVSHD